MEMKKRVLFICVHNSARSQMAEAWLNTMCGEYFEAQSAGLEPGTLNPLAVQVMAEAGIDISKKKPRLSSMSSYLTSYSPTSLRCAARPARRNVLFSQAPRRECIGASPILRRCRAARPRNSNKSVLFATKSGRRLSSGVTRFACKRR
jgi:Low molecular weight phosphotyrosine protein phosphatase